MTYKIIGDSCTDATTLLLPSDGFVQVPLSIHVGGKVIVDDESFHQQTLLDLMAGSRESPRTACPAPSQYLEQFEEGKDTYIVTLSAALSGSYNVAMQARAIYREEGGRGNVHVFNSRSASAGQAQIALLIHQLASAGESFQWVVETVEAYISRMHTMFVLENLDNLRKNGRMTRVQSLVTGTLRVKLLMGGTREGEIEKLGQGLSMRQTLAKMVGRIVEQADHVGRRLVIAHCNCRERAEQVRDMVRQRCDFGEILIVPAGGISTVYASDGGIVIAY